MHSPDNFRPHADTTSHLLTIPNDPSPMLRLHSHNFRRSMYSTPLLHPHTYSNNFRQSNAIPHPACSRYCQNNTTDHKSVSMCSPDKTRCLPATTSLHRPASSLPPQRAPSEQAEEASTMPVRIPMFFSYFSSYKPSLSLSRFENNLFLLL